jgi:hypothetical protein
MKSVIVFAAFLAIIVAGVYVYAYQTFIESEREYREAAIELELKLRRQCADKWPLRGARFDTCMEQGREKYGL